MVKGLVTDQFHLVRKFGRCRHLGPQSSILRPETTLVCSRDEQRRDLVRAIVDMSRFINHVSSRNKSYRMAQQCLTTVTKGSDNSDFHSQQKALKRPSKHLSEPPREYSEQPHGMAPSLVKRGFKLVTSIAGYAYCPLHPAAQTDRHPGFTSSRNAP